MSYTKLNLKNGTVLDETHLAHMEDGILAAQTGLRKVIEYTTEEETLNSAIDHIAFTEDMEGNPLSLKNMLIRIVGTVINNTDNDSILRLGYTSKSNQLWFEFNCSPLNAPFCAYIFLSVTEQGLVAIQAPNKGSQQVSVSTKDTASVTKVTEFDRILLFGNNASKTHLAAGATITVWGF